LDKNFNLRRLCGLTRPTAKAILARSAILLFDEVDNVLKERGEVLLGGIRIFHLLVE